MIEAMEGAKEMIDPSLAGGFRDYLPQDMIPRQKMLDAIRSTFERFGFVPLDTPGIEKEQILTGGDPNFKMQIFKAGLRNNKEDLALRFDLTVPLARVIATYRQEIVRPFKRYQTGKVWRGEKPQAGRFREFIQFDADIVGAKSSLADAEIVALIYETMRALGFEKFLIRVNNRKILNGLAAYAGFPAESVISVLRSIDKLDKQGWPAVRKELLGQAGSDDDTPAGVLNEDQAAALERFLELRGRNINELLASVRELMANSPQAMEGVAELSEIAEHVRALEVPDDKWTVDLSVARGLGYYTGPVFETILTDLPGIGSVFSGGRYDDLVTRFSPMDIPATGASVGVDRLFAAMEQLGLVQQQRTVTKVMLMNFDTGCSLDVERVATNLRRGGIPTEIYFGGEMTLKAQLTHAIKQDIPFVLILGSSEKERGTVQVREVAARQQAEVAQSQIVPFVSDKLGVAR